MSTLGHTTSPRFEVSLLDSELALIPGTETLEDPCWYFRVKSQARCRSSLHWQGPTPTRVHIEIAKILLLNSGDSVVEQQW